jgi:hypothetical protein
MNMHSESFYPYTNGDKDTFHLAGILADARWAMPHYPARWTPTGVYQRDFEGRLVFQHRSPAKWRLTGDNVLAAEFRHQAACLRFLRELRDRWSGRIDAVPPSSPADSEMEDGLAETGWFTLEEPGTESRLLELLPGNRVGIGSSRDCILRWYVRDGVMTIDGATDALPPLSWQGRSPASFAAMDGERAIQLLAAPQAGRDAVGATAAAVLERFADQHAITEDDAVTTIATLAQVGDLANALERAKGRWQHSTEALRVIERADRRIGLRNASADPDSPGYESLE